MSNKKKILIVLVVLLFGGALLIRHYNSEVKPTKTRKFYSRFKEVKKERKSLSTARVEEKEEKVKESHVSFDSSSNVSSLLGEVRKRDKRCRQVYQQYLDQDKVIDPTVITSQLDVRLYEVFEKVEASLFPRVIVDEYLNELMKSLRGKKVSYRKLSDHLAKSMICNSEDFILFSHTVLESLLEKEGLDSNRVTNYKKFLIQNTYLIGKKNEYILPDQIVFSIRMLNVVNLIEKSDELTQLLDDYYDRIARVEELYFSFDRDSELVDNPDQRILDYLNDLKGINDDLMNVIQAEFSEVL